MSGVCGPKLASTVRATSAESLPGSVNPLCPISRKTPMPHIPLAATVTMMTPRIHQGRETTNNAQRVIFLRDIERDGGLDRDCSLRQDPDDADAQPVLSLLSS